MNPNDRLRDNIWQLVGTIVGIAGFLITVIQLIPLPDVVRVTGAIIVFLLTVLCVVLVLKRAFGASQRSPQHTLPPKPSTVNTPPGQNVVTPPLKAASRQSKRRPTPVVVVCLSLLALFLLGGVGFSIYRGVTGNHPSGTSSDLHGVTWSGSQFVAVGDGGTILTSPDGHTWTTQTSVTSSVLKDVVWSGSQFVAVGEYRTILSSSDGRTWTTRYRVDTSNHYLSSVAWSSSQSEFVAVGDDGIILTSPNGHGWTTQTSSTSIDLSSVAWSSSQSVFVAVGNDGIILTSPDGSTWTTRTSGTSNFLSSVAWSASQSEFVAVGSNGTILTSPDGRTWTTQTSSTSDDLQGVAWSGSQFVAVGFYILASANGRTWWNQYFAARLLSNVACSSSLCVAVGWQGTIVTSYDGSTWTT